MATRDRPADLRLCLEALGRLEEQERFEVVVVDDGSGPEIARIVEEAAGRRPNVRYAREAGRGLQHARDRGAAESTAPLIAYLDDDAVVEPGWATALLDSHAELGWSGAAGRILLELLAPEPTWLADTLRPGLSELDLGPGRRRLADGEWPYGANCAVTREAYEAVGGFRAGLDREGRSLLSNGEIEFFRRVRGEHGSLAYVGDAAVRHRVPAGRLTVRYHRRRALAQGVSDERMTPTVGVVARGLRTGRELVRCGEAVSHVARDVRSGQGVVRGLCVAEYARGRLLALYRRDVRLDA